MIEITCGVNTVKSEKLVGKTVREIREALSEQLAIPRDAKALLNGVMADNGTAVHEGTLEFVKETGEKGAAQVKCGPSVTPPRDAYVGQTVRSLRETLRGELSIPQGAPALISKDGGETQKAVSEDYRVQHGDLLEFTKAAGVKG